MAPEADLFLQKPLRGLRRVHEEYRKFTENESNLHYKSGASLNSRDFEVMRTVLDPNANAKFWSPANCSRRCALERAMRDAFEGYSYDLESFLDVNTRIKEDLVEHSDPEIVHAYHASSEYISVIDFLMEEALFDNEGLVDSNNESLFYDHDVHCFRDDIFMETRRAFSTPGYPHITIVSIQPQRAQSQNELLCIEFWTLYYWAKKFARQTTGQYLPMRLVSLCGYEARVVSAVFTLKHSRSACKKMGQSDDQSGVKCRIHIAEYRDLSIRQHYLDLMAELISTPRDFQRSPPTGDDI